MKEEEETEIACRNLTILPKSGTVCLAKKEVILVNKEFELLLLLAENPDLVFSKDTCSRWRGGWTLWQMRQP